MIAADLIIGAPVGRTQIDVFVLAVLKTECDSNKAARRAGGASGRTSRQVYFDRAIVKEPFPGFTAFLLKKGVS
jgi:hypothetical protein